MKLSPHGREVVRLIEAEDGLDDFVQLWRQNFLDTMKPKFLPSGWRIDHKTIRLFGEYSKFQNLQSKD